MRCFAWTCVALFAATGWGCDDNNEIPPEVLRARQAAMNQRETTKPAPTTQELVSGTKITLRLGEFPLSLEAPPTWTLKSMAEGQVITVGGPASSGEISIQLNSQNQSISAVRLADIVAAAKAENAAKPHPINRVEMRDLGAAKLLEHRMISNAFTNGKLPPEVLGETPLVNEKTQEVRMIKGIINPHIVKWNFTVFIPTGENKYIMRSLTFMSLKLSEYEQDKEFLEQLMKSMKYEE